MWLALIMAFNVWFIIWPNQKKALGLVEADADTKKKAARIAMLASRTNTLLSIPMLYCMVGAGQCRLRRSGIEMKRGPHGPRFVLALGPVNW